MSVERPPIKEWQQKVQSYGSPIVVLLESEFTHLCKWVHELEQQLADNDVAFKHAQEIIKKYQEGDPSASKLG